MSAPPGRASSVRSIVLGTMIGVGAYVAVLGVYVAAVLGPTAADVHDRALTLAAQYDSLRSRTSHLEDAFWEAERLSAGPDFAPGDRERVDTLRAQVESLARQSAGVQASRLLSRMPPGMRVALAELSGAESGLSGMLFEALAALQRGDRNGARSWLARAESERSALVDRLGDAERVGIEDAAEHARRLGVQASQIAGAVALWALLGVALVAVALVLLHRRLYRPLLALDRGLARVSGGDFDTSVPVRRNDELGRLSESFNEMVRVLARRPEVEELRRSEARFRALIEQAPVAILASRGFDGLYANPAFARMFGLHDAGDARGRDILGYYAPESREEAEERVRRRAEGDPEPAEYRAMGLRTDGSSFPVRVTVARVHLSGGPADLWFVTDITEHERAQADLALKNLILSTQQETSLDGILVVDEHDRVLSCNRRFAEVWEIPPELVSPGSPDPPILEAVCQRVADPDAFVARVRDLYRHREEESSEEILLQDGRVIDRYSAPMMGSDGRYYGRVWYVRDVTARKLAEEALKAREEQFRTAFMTVSDAHLLVTREEGRIVEVNGRFVDLFGHSRQEAIGRTSLELGLFDRPEDRDRMLAALDSEGKVRDLEVLGRRRDGSTVPVLLSVSKLEARGQGLLLEVFRDLSELRRADEALRDLEEQFRQAQRLEAVGRLAGGVAHDFNNVLTVITGMSELLLADLDGGDPRREEVLEIRKAAQRATALTRQLLAFSRKQVLQPRPIDLNGLIDGLAPMLTRLIGEDVALHLSLADGLSAVHADPGQIEQVIVNLAVNARDAMPYGGQVTVETRNVEVSEADHPDIEPGDYVLLEVTDTGHGMDAATRSRIFDPFYTTKEPGKGTGLGLSTVHGIVTQSGGAVSVESGPERGASFKVYLPSTDQHVETADATAGARDVAGGLETVLMVEDDAAVRRVMVEALAQLGYEVLVAEDGSRALEVVRKHEGEVDLLVTDLVMPGMSGRELAEILAADRPGLRTLYVSGYTDDQAVRQGVVEKGQPYLQKPFTPKELGARIREVLDRDG